MGLLPPLMSLLLSGVALAGGEGTANVPSAPHSAAFEPLLLPGGIVDPTGRTAYLANAHGGIDAVDLASGELLWETAEAQRPLMVLGSHLLAQAGVKRNRLRILAFDVAARGECVLESDPVVLPGWVVTGEAPGRSFKARWQIDHNHLVLAWEAAAWFAGPGRPTALQQEAARRRAAGTARIDLDSGQVESGPPEPPLLGPPGPPADALERKAVRWQGCWGGRAYALELQSSDAQQVLLLHSWDLATGKEAPAIELLRGKHLRAQASLDGQYLCLRPDVPPPDDKGLRKIGREESWTLFALATGQPVARLVYEPGTQGITILGTRVYYAVVTGLRGPLDRPQPQPQMLKAVDLASGKTLWQRPIAARTLAAPLP